MLALPADARGCGEGLFHQRGSIDKDFHVGIDLISDTTRELFEAAFEDVVVILAACIDGQCRVVRPSQSVEWVCLGGVVRCDHDDGAGIRPQRLRVAAALMMCCHPIHVAMAVKRNEVVEAR